MYSFSLLSATVSNLYYNNYLFVCTPLHFCFLKHDLQTTNFFHTQLHTMLIEYLLTVVCFVLPWSGKFGVSFSREFLCDYIVVCIDIVLVSAFHSYLYVFLSCLLLLERVLCVYCILYWMYLCCVLNGITLFLFA